MGKAGAMISGTLSPNAAGMAANMRSNQSITSSMAGSGGGGAPGQSFSFKEALVQVEEELLLLAAEVNYCKREMQN